jgi:hypothetical protein
MHKNGIRTAFGHFVHSTGQVHQPVNGPHADTMIHGHDDGSSRVSVDDAFHTDTFTEQHAKLLFPFSAPDTCGQKKRAAGFSPAALDSVYLLVFRLLRSDKETTDASIAKKVVPKVHVRYGGSLGLHCVSYVLNSILCNRNSDACVYLLSCYRNCQSAFLFFLIFYFRSFLT